MDSEKLNQIYELCSKLSSFVSFKRRRLFSDIKELLAAADSSLVEFKQKYTKANAMLKVRARELKLKNLEHQELKNVHDEVATRFSLTASLLSARPVYNAGLDKFKNLFSGEFVKFANEESALAKEAQAILMMQSIERDLERVVSYPEIFKKTIIAIGGGFSSGKSELANSFFLSEKVKLPVGLEPVTAIPTYIISSDKEAITGFSCKGGSIELSPEIYGKLSHEYVKSFGFSLREIMPYVAVGTPMEAELFEHICLIDTPGYNPALDDGYTEEDSKVACEYIQHANTLIWMLGLDSNGTISRSDIDFIERLNLSEKQLFVVANKADLKPESEREDILKEIQNILEDLDIPYEGICAYSAIGRKEYCYLKKSFTCFLKEQNKCIFSQKNVLARLNEVFGMYEKAIKKNIRDSQSIEKKLHSFRLDLLPLSLNGELDSLQNDSESGPDPWAKRIDQIARLMQNETSEKHSRELRRLKGLLVDAVDEIFSGIKSPVSASRG